jgi:hypothetical protein
MTEPLNSATISALAALSGSLVGAMGSALASWNAQKHTDRRSRLAAELAYREQLYSDFITESAKAIFDATQHTFQDPLRLVPVYALLSRIRLSSSTKVVEGAEEVIRTVLKTYSEPNLTPADIQAHAAERKDPLRDFSNICRSDLESLWRVL